MGNDLSIILRPCVSLPENSNEAEQQQQQDSSKVNPNDNSCEECSASYNEFRLIEGSDFNLQELLTKSENASTPPRLLVAECTPQSLVLFNPFDAVAFPFLHSELRCKRCAGRIGLVIDPSVRIGQRLYDAEVRHAFTQSLTLFLSKIVETLEAVIVALEEASGDVNDSTGKQLSSDLVDTRPNSPTTPRGISKQGFHLRHELFLLDLQHCLLDDVSGPWIVRDIMDHMGRVLHYHSAVSILCGNGLSSLPHLQLLQGVKMIAEVPKETSTESRELLKYPINKYNIMDIISPSSNVMELTFCKSLRRVILSNNNMSLVGLRKCLLEFLNYDGQEGEPLLKRLEVINVRENEETLAAQSFVNEMSKLTSANILIGTSGKRWRHPPVHTIRKIGEVNSMEPIILSKNHPFITSSSNENNVTGNDKTNEELENERKFMDKSEGNQSRPILRNATVPISSNTNYTPVIKSSKGNVQRGMLLPHFIAHPDKEREKEEEKFSTFSTNATVTFGQPQSGIDEQLTKSIEESEEVALLNNNNNDRIHEDETGEILFEREKEIIPQEGSQADSPAIRKPPFSWVGECNPHEGNIIVKDNKRIPPIYNNFLAEKRIPIGNLQKARRFSSSDKSTVNSKNIDLSGGDEEIITKTVAAAAAENSSSLRSNNNNSNNVSLNSPAPKQSPLTNEKKKKNSKNPKSQTSVGSVLEEEKSADTHIGEFVKATNSPLTSAKKSNTTKSMNNPTTITKAAPLVIKKKDSLCTGKRNSKLNRN